jgi:hypothetical protein
VTLWGVLWRSDNRLDGSTRHLLGAADHPTRTLLFETRAAARAYVRERWGYIAGRPDLQAEPHGWRVPEVVRVAVSVVVVAT